VDGYNLRFEGLSFLRSGYDGSDVIVEKFDDCAVTPAIPRMLAETLNGSDMVIEKCDESAGLVWGSD
jgi:hypothetical protein